LFYVSFAGVGLSLGTVGLGLGLGLSLVTAGLDYNTENPLVHWCAIRQLNIKTVIYQGIFTTMSTFIIIPVILHVT